MLARLSVVVVLLAFVVATIPLWLPIALVTRPPRPKKSSSNDDSRHAILVVG